MQRSEKMTEAEHDAHPFLGITVTLFRFAVWLVKCAVLLSVGLAILVGVAYTYGFAGICTVLAVPAVVWLVYDSA